MISTASQAHERHADDSHAASMGALCELVRSLAPCRGGASGETVRALLSEARDRLRVKHISFCIVVDPHGTIIEDRVITTYPDRWIGRYLSRKYWMVDPVLLAFYRGDEECSWDSRNEEPGVQAPFVTTFLRDARENGAGACGHAFFLRLGRRGSFTFTLSSDEPGRQFRDRIEAMRREIDFIFASAQEAICGYDDGGDEHLASLTDDEMLLLRLLSAGGERADIEASVAFDRSFDSIVASLQRKLGARNLSQAIYRFAELRMKEFFPPTSLEIKSLGS